MADTKNAGSARSGLVTPLRRWVAGIRKCTRTHFRASDYAKEFGFSIARDLCPNQFRTSDTLFIMGSGESVAYYTHKEWDTIAAHDSIGFNNFYVSGKLTTFYFYEGGIEQYTNAFIRNFPLLDPEFFHRPVIALCAMYNRDLFTAWPDEARQNLYLNNYLMMGNVTEGGLSRAYGMMDRLGHFKPGSKLGYGICQKASLDAILHFAIVAGYKEVILCGVDLNSPRYFFSPGTPMHEQVTAAGFELPHVDKVQTGTVHKTLSRDEATMPIDRVLGVMQKSLLDKKGIALKVAKQSSALYPQLDSYFE